MFLPNGVHLELAGDHDVEGVDHGAHVWTQTVSEAGRAIDFFEAMGLTVRKATVRETEDRMVPLDGWRLDARR